MHPAALYAETIILRLSFISDAHLSSHFFFGCRARYHGLLALHDGWNADVAAFDSLPPSLTHSLTPFSLDRPTVFSLNLFIPPRPSPLLPLFSLLYESPPPLYLNQYLSVSLCPSSKLIYLALLSHWPFQLFTPHSFKSTTISWFGSSGREFPAVCEGSVLDIPPATNNVCGCKIS